MHAGQTPVQLERRTCSSAWPGSWSGTACRWGPSRASPAPSSSWCLPPHSGAQRGCAGRGGDAAHQVAAVVALGRQFQRTTNSPANLPRMTLYAGPLECPPLATQKSTRDELGRLPTEQPRPRTAACRSPKARCHRTHAHTARTRTLTALLGGSARPHLLPGEGGGDLGVVGGERRLPGVLEAVAGQARVVVLRRAAVRHRPAALRPPAGRHHQGAPEPRHAHPPPPP